MRPALTGGPLKKRKKPSKPALWERATSLFSLIEHLPYGASLIQEKKAYRGLLGLGILTMAFGAALFATGWWAKWSWLVETAFVITLVGWMMVILGSAFWVVSTLAKKFPVKDHWHW